MKKKQVEMMGTLTQILDKSPSQPKPMYTRQQLIYMMPKPYNRGHGMTEMKHAHNFYIFI